MRREITSIRLERYHVADDADFIISHNSYCKGRLSNICPLRIWPYLIGYYVAENGFHFYYLRKSNFIWIRNILKLSKTQVKTKTSNSFRICVNRQFYNTFSILQTTNRSYLYTKKDIKHSQVITRCRFN